MLSCGTKDLVWDLGKFLLLLPSLPLLEHNCPSHVSLNSDGKPRAKCPVRLWLDNPGEGLLKGTQKAPHIWRQGTKILKIGSSEMFFTLRQMSISIWILVVQTQLLLILKQQHTCLTRVLKVWSYEFDEKTSTVGWNVSLRSPRKAEFYLKVHSANTESSLESWSRCVASSWEMWHHTFSVHRKWGLCTTVAPGASDTGRKRTLEWDFWVWDFWALCICSRNAQSGSVCTKKLRKGINPAELNPSRPLSVGIRIHENKAEWTKCFEQGLSRREVSGKLVFLQILPGTDRIFDIQKLRWKQEK